MPDLDDDRPIRTPLPAYTELAGRYVCDHIAIGYTLEEIEELPGMPPRRQVFQWIARYPDFAAAYDAARSKCVEVWATEVIEIADRADVEPRARRVMIDARLAMMRALKPAKYGDRKAIEVTGTLSVATLDVGKLAPADLLKVADALDALRVVGSGSTDGARPGVAVASVPAAVVENMEI